MPNSFSRTTRSLEASRPHAWTVLVLAGAVLLAGWLAWLIAGRVAIYEVSQEARLEVQAAVHPLAAQVGGRVVASHLAIGREVVAGETVVELDSESERLAMLESRARIEDLTAQIEALGRELEAEEAMLAAQRDARRSAVAEANAQAAEAEMRARFAEAEAERADSLAAAGSLSRSELERARTEADALRATAEALRLAARRLDHDRRVIEEEHHKRIAELNRQVVALRGQLGIEEARLERLAYVVEQRRVRAPVSGRIGELFDIEIGSVVQPGQRLASVVPPGELLVVGFFPTAAMGRIQPGQPARVRLTGFPWPQYGSLNATVTHTANESRNGRFRVELALHANPTPRVPVEHGLPGVVEVEVDHLSPLRLVLHSVGKARDFVARETQRRWPADLDPRRDAAAPGPDARAGGRRRTRHALPNRAVWPASRR